MTARWTPRGQIEAASITHIALSPGFARDRTLLVGTLAGVAVSRDGGKSWENPARGVVGPFIRDIALSPTFSTDRIMYAASSGGLFRSTDGGREWQAATQEQLAGLIATARDGTLYLVPEGDTRVWRGSVAGQRCEPVGHLPDIPLTLVVDAAVGVLWAITEKGVACSCDGGASWHQLTLPVAARCQALAICGPERVAIGTEEKGVLLYRRDGTWELPAAVGGLGVTALAASHDGAVIAAGTQEGTFISSDAGRTWAAPAEAIPVLSVAMTSDARHMFAGLAGGGCHRLVDPGCPWEALPGISGALVANLHAKADLVIARTVDGIIAQSGDAGRTWTTCSPTPMHVLAVAPDVGDGFALAASDGSVRAGSTLRPPLRAEIRDLAMLDRLGTCPLIAVADAGEVVLSDDRGETWTSDTPPMETGDEIVEIAFGRPGNQVEPLLAVATLTRQGMGELWLRAQDGSWRRLVAHQAGAAGIHLAVVDGPRGIFFTAGATVYRPARVGALVFSGESPGGPDGGAVLQVAAIREQAGEVTLAVLSTGGFYLSHDGGLSWSRHPFPAGPPITAITLRTTVEGVEMLVAHVGGSISAASVGGAPA